MKRASLSLILILIPSVFACMVNYDEVSVSGQVTDSLTGQPIAGAEIQVACWVYDMSIWASKKVVRDTLTDENGAFQIVFEKGTSIDIEVMHPSYQPSTYSRNLERNSLKARLSLQKAP